MFLSTDNGSSIFEFLFGIYPEDLGLRIKTSPRLPKRCFQIARTILASTKMLVYLARAHFQPTLYLPLMMNTSVWLPLVLQVYTSGLTSGSTIFSYPLSRFKYPVNEWYIQWTKSRIIRGQYWTWNRCRNGAHFFSLPLFSLDFKS